MKDYGGDTPAHATGDGRQQDGNGKMTSGGERAPGAEENQAKDEVAKVTGGTGSAPPPLSDDRAG